jgi:hypothetical protein
VQTPAQQGEPRGRVAAAEGQQQRLPQDQLPQLLVARLQLLPQVVPARNPGLGRGRRQAALPPGQRLRLLPGQRQRGRHCAVEVAVL